MAELEGADAKRPSAVGALATFEVSTQLRSWATGGYALLLFGCGVVTGLLGAGAFQRLAPSTGSVVYANSPGAFAHVLASLSLVTALVAAGVAGQAGLKDALHRTDRWFLALPLTPAQLMLGRLLGALFVLLLLSSLVPLGYLAAVQSPLAQPARVGPSHPGALLEGAALFFLVDVLLAGVAFYALAHWRRSLVPVYAALVALVTAKLLSSVWHGWAAALLEPSGTLALERQWAFLTVAERNASRLVLSWPVWGNRLFWLTAVGLTFAASWARFARGPLEVGGGSSRARPSGVRSLEVRPLLPREGGARWLGQVLHEAGFAWRWMFRSAFFWALLVFTLTGAVLSARYGFHGELGAVMQPTTPRAVVSLLKSFHLALFLLPLFFAGELVWRARDHGFAGIDDALPTHPGLRLSGQLLALVGVQAVLLLWLALVGAGVQRMAGFHPVHFGLSLYLLFAVELPSLAVISAVALGVHHLVGHKSVGHVLLVLVYLEPLALAEAGIDSLLATPASLPTLRYSELAGFHGQLLGLRWLQLYAWGVMAVLLFAAYLFWSRGAEPGRRLAKARGRLTAPVAVGMALSLALAVGAGASFQARAGESSPDARHAAQADYERSFAAAATRPGPTLIQAELDVTVAPEEGAVLWKGRYVLENRTDRPIRSLLFSDLPVGETTYLGPVRVLRAMPLLGVTQLGLDAPLAPGARMQVGFAQRLEQDRFALGHPWLSFDGLYLWWAGLPHLGYQPSLALKDERLRAAQGLRPLAPLPAHDDPALASLIREQAPRPSAPLHLTVRAPPGFTVLTPAAQPRRWTDPQGAHLEATLDDLDTFALVAGRLEVTRRELDGKRFEVYVHPGHDWNTATLLKGMVDATRYNARWFGPAPFETLRVGEFSGEDARAQTFPGLIAISEDGGMGLATPPGEVNPSYFLIAHETSHEWWGVGVVRPAEARGTQILSEGMANYLAERVVKANLGALEARASRRRLLRSYLRGFGARPEEPPLIDSGANGLGTDLGLFYDKSALLLSGLAETVGEEPLNRALGTLVAEVRARPGRRAMLCDLLAALKRVTPPELAYLLHDGFEKVVVYEVVPTRAEASALGGNRYRVRLHVDARKLEVSGGPPRAIPLHDRIEVGVEDDAGHPLALKAVWLDAGDNLLTLEVEGRPATASADPRVLTLNRAVDRASLPITIR